MLHRRHKSLRQRLHGLTTGYTTGLAKGHGLTPGTYGILEIFIPLPVVPLFRYSVFPVSPLKIPIIYIWCEN